MIKKKNNFSFYLIIGILCFPFIVNVIMVLFGQLPNSYEFMFANDLGNKEWLSFNNIHNYNIYVLPGEPIGVKGKIIAYRNLRRQMLLTRPDCLIIFSLGLAEIGVFVAKTVCVPTILSERVDPKYLPQSKIHRLLKLLVYHFCDGIVFQTVQVKQYFSKSIQKKSIVIQNPIMDDNLPVANDNSAEKEIVAVGRLSIEKNYKLLIRAFAELNIPEYRLKIFGKGPLFNELSDLIDSLRMNDKIILEGSVDRVVDFIRNSDIFVLSSNHEGMPNALIEAMAMGLEIGRASCRERVYLYRFFFRRG